MTIGEKIANLKGFVEGMEMDANKPENRILGKILDILEDISLEMEDIVDSVDTLEGYTEELDEDLGDLEEYIYGEDIGDDCFCDDFDGMDCPECGERVYFDDDDDDEEYSSCCENSTCCGDKKEEE